MAQVDLRVYGSLRSHLGEYSTVRCSCIRDGETVGELCDRLRLPREAVTVVFVNSRRAGLDHPLSDGDRVSLFPLVAGG